VFRLLIIVLLVLGIFFRFFHLDHKVYWFDEVYTSFRAAGYTSSEIDREILQNKLITPAGLQKFQQIKPDSTVADTIHSLAIEDPQHPPLYFVMARGWMQMFGGSLAASRSLPALLSLLSLPLMYGLAKELFADRLTATIATTLLALSPVDLLFAQTARQYSLLVAAIIASSYMLLKAVKKSTWLNWSLYSLACAIGLYTHPFFGLNIIGNAVFIIVYYLSIKKQKSKLFKYIIASLFSLFLYSPWLIVMLGNSDRAFRATSWATKKTDFIYLIKQWIVSFSSLFFDLEISSNDLINCLPRLPFVALILVAIYAVFTKANNLAKTLILTSIFVPFLLLAVPDLLVASRRSSVTRYLISCFPGVQLAVAYYLSTIGLSLYKNQKLWRFGLAILFTSSIVSCSVSAFADTWWSKGVSYNNAAAAKVINRSHSALVVSDRGDGSLGKGNLISLSYFLNPQVQILPLSSPPNIELVKQISRTNNSDTFLFKPSAKFWQALKSQPKKDFMLVEQTLWRIKFD
jgi:uncharacterized membrane protein